MEVTVEDLRKRYESLENDELIDLLLNSELTQSASSVLKEVLAVRGITKHRVKEYATELAQPGIVTATLPKMWIGYIFAVVLFLYEIFETVNNPRSVHKISPVLWIIAISAWIYWLFCVRSMHRIIAQFTNGKHTISPSEAMWFHLLPLFNLYWIFKWPNEISNFVNKRLATKSMSKGWPGFFLLISIFLGRAVDKSLGLIGIFAVGAYINNKIHSVVKLEHSNPVTTEPNNRINQTGQ